MESKISWANYIREIWIYKIRIVVFQIFLLWLGFYHLLKPSWWVKQIFFLRWSIKLVGSLLMQLESKVYTICGRKFLYFFIIIFFIFIFTIYSYGAYLRGMTVNLDLLQADQGAYLNNTRLMIKSNYTWTMEGNRMPLFQLLLTRVYSEDQEEFFYRGKIWTSNF